MREVAVKPGDVVEGRYKILRPIAEGGMGTVFLAEHWLIKRRVALKFLRADLASDATAIRRFVNEAHAAGTLGHPNIVESTDMGFTTGDVPYIVYEYVDGVLLAREISGKGPLPAARAIAIAYQIAAALDAAHEAGIVHRDLKTDNVFLADRPTADHVKVLDFGISRFITATDRTAAGSTLIGTPEFMAPEQILQPDQVDKRVDIYALGVVLYEMLAGKVPFPLESPDMEGAHKLLARIIEEEPPPLVLRDAPVGLAEMIREKMLAKDPNRRFQSMRDVQAALEAFGGVLPNGRLAFGTQVAVEDEEPMTRPIEPIRTPAGIELDAVSVAREVRALGRRWSLTGTDLQLELYSAHMAQLVRALAGAAAIADEVGQHPRVELAVPRLRLVIADCKTVVDLVLAARIEQWLRTNGW